METTALAAVTAFVEHFSVGGTRARRECPEGTCPENEPIDDTENPQGNVCGAASHRRRSQDG